MKFWKKAIALIGVVSAVGFFTAACANNSDSASNASSSNSTQVSNSKNSLIVYFSLTGNTKKAADQIHKATGAKEVRILPKKAYPNDYDRDTQIARREKESNARPKIKNKLPNLSKYKTIYVGFPTWWTKPPMIIHTLFDQYNFKGKTIVPFTTSGETPMSSSMPVMRSLARKDGAKTINGFRYDNNNQALRSFLRKNNLIK